MFRRTELYRFVEGSVINTQTSGNAPVTYNAGDGDELYTPFAIGRSVVEVKNELSKASLELSLALNNPVAQRYLSGIVDTVLTLTVFQQTNATTNVIWKGRLAKVKLSNKKVSLIFESIFTSMRRPGLRARWQKNCRHSLYGPGCTVDKALFAFNDDVVSISGVDVVMTDLSLFADGYFSGGMIETLDDNVLRYIIAHVGNNLTLARSFDHLAALVAAGPPPIAVNLYPGCAKTMTVCDGTFSNIDNYGGFPWIPNKNPMGGSSIL